MKKYLIALFLCGWLAVVWGQEQRSFKERNTVRLNFDSVEYISKDQSNWITTIERKNIIYGCDSSVISFETEIKRKPKPAYFTSLSSSITGLSSNVVSANLKVDSDKIYIYPWVFEKNKKANDFFEQHDIYITMKNRNNYRFSYRSWQMGVVTLPLKWYMNSNLGNINTSVNAMLNIGYKWGESRFVKFPHEKDARTYKTGYSINILAGISKLEFNKMNTSKSETPIEKADVAAISLGAAFGIHYGDFTFIPTVGFDLPTAHRKDWNFNNIPWLGIGIGYNFLKFN